MQTQNIAFWNLISNYIFQNALLKDLRNSKELWTSWTIFWNEKKTENNRQKNETALTIRSINLKLNKDKFKIGIAEIRYFGHTLSTEGPKLDKEKVIAIAEMPKPTG